LDGLSIEHIIASAAAKIDDKINGNRRVRSDDEARSRLATFRESVDNHLLFLDAEEAVLRRLRNNGVRGQDRDFSEIIDVNRAAMTVFASAREQRLSREWPLIAKA